MAQLRSVPELLKLHAELRGQQAAFSSPGGRTVNYADLATRTYLIGQRLRASGVSKGDRVAIVLSSCIEAIEATYGTTRAAGIVVPLNVRSSEAELAWAFENSRPRVVVTDENSLIKVRGAIDGVRSPTEPLPVIVTVAGPSNRSMAACTTATKLGTGLEIVQYDDWVTDTLHPTFQQHFSLDNLDLEEPAYLHYTTGTTGQPKGVVSSQRAWMWTAVNSYVSSLGLADTDMIFWPLPLFHAFGQSVCVIGTLAVGATTHLVGEAMLLDELLQHRQSTIIAGAPPIFREIATNEAARERLPQLRPRACISAGSAPPRGLSSQIKKLFDVHIINHYGCTECGCIATHSPEDVGCEASCGEPIPGVEVQIRHVKDDGEIAHEVEDGEEGEICVRTPSFMLGYTDDCNGDLNPYLPVLQDGWYRTGDLGFQSELNLSTNRKTLTVTGRLKELIIRGGENIHPLQVEMALRTCPEVNDVVVTGLPHDMLGEVPAAFIVPKSGAELKITELLDACRALLPDYKVPIIFYSVEYIAHTASGKPKRLAAKELLRTGKYGHALVAQLPTEDMLETLVLAEINAVCGLGPGLGQLDPDQNFMSLGLNSLKSIVLRDRLASLTGLELPITLAFDCPTPMAVVRYLRDQLFEIHGGEKNQSTIQDAADRTADAEPIAIVSMACRYPGGVDTPEKLWDVVREGRDMTSDFPTNRDWNVDTLYNPDPNNIGTCTATRGGFIHDMADFDPAFFGMSPREALATDPQQRLLLETTHTLIERAGIAPDSIRGSSTGVFVGLIYSDYAARFEHGSGKGHDAEAHLDIGSSPSVAAGRISYTFDFKGPSMAIDAACSSSLTAIHLAAQSLRTRESGALAIAGGVTLMSTPRQFIAFSRQRGLSSDGRCRSYAADANGTGWSEGVGLILLERLSDAHRNGHKVFGLIRGSAVNNDGFSAGLTVPSGPAQQEVIRKALSSAGLSPGDIDVLDGHGTATSLGDPIELRAIQEVYGDRSGSAPLLLGSLKSNIGHTQAAAGVASVMKMILGMQHGIAPASINITRPSPHINWAKDQLELLTVARAWPEYSEERPRRAAVSSFGISGTNAHVILEHVTIKAPRFDDVAVVGNCYPWLLSGTDEAALRAQARAVAGITNNERAIDIAFSLATTRSSYSHRAAITGSGEELEDALKALEKGQQHPNIFTGLTRSAKSTSSRSKPRLAFLFSGQGSQRLNMGRELCARFPRFDAAFKNACKYLDAGLEHPLQGVLWESCESTIQGTRLIDRADFAQAAIFAFEVAMFRLLESWGIHPDCVAGHSLGEICAAHVAGWLSLADAATIVTTRGKLMAALPQNGSMVSITASENEVKEALQEMNAQAQTAIAAVNAHNSVVVSGPADTVAAIKELFQKRKRPVVQLRVSHAFHSPLMEPILEAFAHAVRTLRLLPRVGGRRIPLVSTVTGRVVSAMDLTADYWINHVVFPVRFADAIRTLSSTEDIKTFVEIGPSAPLANFVPNAIATSGRKEDEVDLLLKASAKLWVCGIAPQASGGRQGWDMIFKGSGAHVVDLPPYPFQRRRYWLDTPTSVLTMNGLKSAHENRSDDSSKERASDPVLKSPNGTTGVENTNIYPWQTQLGALPSGQRDSVILELVSTIVAAVLGYQGGESLVASALDEPLTDLGCDSVMSIQLRDRLTKQSGVMLPKHLILDEATSSTRALADHVLGQLSFPG